MRRISVTPASGDGTCAMVASSRPSPAAVAHVAGFLTHCRGLAGLGDAELDALFHSAQLDATLAALPSATTGNTSATSKILPPLEDIPDQNELHDLLVGGFVPHGHQMIAHILYPDVVHWPFDPQPRRADGQSGSATPSPSGRQQQQQQQEQQSQQQQLSSISRSSVAGGRSGSNSRPRGHSKERYGACGETLGDPVLEEVHDGHTVELCGLKIASTVRGRSLQGHHERSVVLAQLEEPDDRHYKAAREKREKAEKAAQLEEYHERTIQAQIKELEDLRAAEIAKQELLQKREESRRAHHDALKRKIEEGWELDIQKEKAKKDLEEEQKRVKAKSETLAKQYHKQQKERLEKWWGSGENDDVVSRRSKAKDRHEDIVNKKKLRDAEKQMVARTDKQQEVVAKVQKIHALVQERPPLALPRQHDLPRPLVMLPAEKERAVTGKSELTDKLTPRRAPRHCRVPSHGDWKSEAELFSRKYGLSDRDKSLVRSHLSRGISGAGRLAEYEKQPQAAAFVAAA